MAAASLTKGERRLGLFLGAAATTAFVALSGGRTLFLAIGLPMGLGLVAASLARNRVAAAFLAFVTAFGPWSFAAVFGIFYAGFALWLLARASTVRSPVPSEGTTAARGDDGPVT